MSIIKQNENGAVSVIPAYGLRGEINLPGDKSIAHRAALFASLAVGESLFENFPPAEDPLATVRCLYELGVEYEHAGKTLWLESDGLYRFRSPRKPLDARNSGTTMRLLAGVLCGQSFASELTGDESLLRRPMRRIIKPLKMMNARIAGTKKGTAPLKIHGTKRGLKNIYYELPVASAQVKTAVLLAGLYAAGTTTVVEALPTRDHTERMLRLPVKKYGGKSYISINKSLKIPPYRMVIPGDPSAAAFFIVGALISPDSELIIRDVSLNQTRIAFLSVLQRMRADIKIINERNPEGEPVGDICVTYSKLRGTNVEGAEVPLVIDELPILAVAGACAEGIFVVKNAEELRYKESDRIHSVVTNLRAMGVQVQELDDGFVVHGGKLHGGVSLDSFGDHRLAMASVIAGLAADKEISVSNMNAAAVSFPAFIDELKSLTYKN